MVLNESLRRSRLEEVAQAYLRRPQRRTRLVVVAGPAGARTREACELLQRAAQSIGLSSILARRDSDTLDLELAEDAGPTLIVYDHGAVDESQLAALDPPGDGGPDLLLWLARPSLGHGPWWIYLLSMLMWSLRPSQVRCVLPPSAGQEEGLVHLRRELARSMVELGLDERVELLVHPPHSRKTESMTLFVQILQSLLAAPRPRARPVLRSASRRASAILAAMLVSTMMVAAPRASDPDVAAEFAVVEILGLQGEGSAVHSAPGGAELRTGPHHALRIAPGVGAWSSDDDLLTLSSRRDQILFVLDGDTLTWAAGSHRIDHELLVHAPEFSLVLRRGRLDLEPGRAVVRPVLKSTPLSGRGGMFLALSLAGVIFFLMWRASSVQRRLDQPRSSVRRRGGR